MAIIFSRNPAVFCGIDGCRGGWVAVFLPKSGPAHAWVQVHSRWAGLPIGEVAVAAVDMPIGLPATGSRGCDMLARDLLGAARSRVFPHLRRPLLRFIGDWRAASEWAKRDGKGISKQAFNILPKIAEIDDWIAPADQARVREAHPELAFARLNRGVALPSKATQAGLRVRRHLLRAAGFTGLDALWRAVKAQGKVHGKARGKTQGKAEGKAEGRPGGVRPDDLYDACVLAITARRIARGRGACLDSGSRDPRGLKMEIWW